LNELEKIIEEILNKTVGEFCKIAYMDYLTQKKGEKSNFETK
jgi:hypothetical protein